MQPWEFHKSSKTRKIENMYLTHVKHACVRCKHKDGHGCSPSWARAKEEPWGTRIVPALSPQLGMPHLTANPRGPQQVLTPLWQGVNTAFWFAVHHILQLQPSNIHKVLSLLFNWVKYVMISKSNVCVCVCAFCSSLPTWQNDWYHSKHSE